jgi:ubiquinone/menaquinone biosynthesis C-methylase UbiE
LIGAVALAKSSRIVDVGGGASLLVDRLVARGFTGVTVVDVSEAALGVARQRLGPRAATVAWVVSDARRLELAEPVDLWHDRAVFHFMTGAEDRKAYLDGLRRTVRPGGHVVLATFAPQGPDKCSGLPVSRYDASGLVAALGTGFCLLKSLVHRHQTPSGGSQPFTYALFRRET